MADPVIGTFEANGKGGGFLRFSKTNYAAKPTDPIMPVKLCQSLGLRGGEAVEAELQKSSSNNRSKQTSVASVTSINDLTPDAYLETAPFEELTAIAPEKQVRFETPDGPSSMRIVDLMTPIGFGQRGLIVAAPRTGKTILLQQLAQGVAINYPDVYMMVLLIDERPEEVTDMRRTVNGEVVASSNDEDIASHVRIARLMIQKAKRMVECGRDVFILLDSLTRLGRAFNASIRGSGRIMSGGLDIRALIEPKGIFGAARKVEHGGSLTVIASALIDTGSRMDEVIFNEFKGTGNMEIVLCRDMANRRIWPAIDLNQSGTRKEELLLTPEALAASHHIRRTLLEKEPIRAMETLLDAMKRFPNTKDFIDSIQQQRIR